MSIQPRDAASVSAATVALRSATELMAVLVCWCFVGALLWLPMEAPPEKLTGRLEGADDIRDRTGLLFNG